MKLEYSNSSSLKDETLLQKGSQKPAKNMTKNII